MKTKTMAKRFGWVALLLTVLLLAPLSAWSAETRAGDASHRFGDNGDALKGAIEKTGFFNGIEDDRVAILEENSYRELKYMMSRQMVITRDGLVLEQKTVLPHSIVKLIIIDAEVVELVLLQESS